MKINKKSSSNGTGKLIHFDFTVSATLKAFWVFPAVSPTSWALSTSEPVGTCPSGEVWARLCWRTQPACPLFPPLRPDSFQQSRWLMLCKLTQRPSVWGVESPEPFQICWANSSYAEMRIWSSVLKEISFTKQLCNSEKWKLWTHILLLLLFYCI